jgi:hypothetical protein
MKYIYFLILISTSILSVKSAMAESPNFMNTINSYEEFKQLQRNQNGLNFSKFLYEFKTIGKKIYFQNTKKYEFHFPFIKENLPQYKNLSYSDYERMILSESLKELTAGAVYYSPKMKLPEFTTTGVIGINIYFGSKVNLNQIAETYNKIQASIPFIQNNIVYIFEKKIDYFKNRIKLKALGVVSTTLSKFMDLTNKPVVYNADNSYGYLKYLSLKKFNDGEYTAKDIIILDSVPLDIGPSSGIITSEPQVPHSHVILRAINQRIPDIYIPNALDKNSIKNNIGKLVQLNVNENGTYSIKAEDDFNQFELEKLANEYFNSRAPTLPELRYDLSRKEPLVWKNTPLIDNAIIFGAKGANFANLDIALRNKFINRNTFNGSFLIPFSYYDDHISQQVTNTVCKKAQKKCNKSGDKNFCKILTTECLTAVDQNNSIRTLIESYTTNEKIKRMLASATYRKSSISIITLTVSVMT